MIEGGAALAEVVCGEAEMPSRAPAAALAAEAVTVRSRAGRKVLLDRASLRLAPGEFACVIGPSGCGKSTLLRCLAGVREPSSGVVRLAGREVTKLREECPLVVGYLPQFGAFHGRATVSEILADGLALRAPSGTPRAVRDAWLGHIAEIAGLEPVMGQRYETLSGGQMRRVALAEQLLGDPGFLFLDELTSGLDVHAEAEMMAWLRRLATDHGKTVVLVTHATARLALCDSIVFMADGRIVNHAPPGELLERLGAGTLEELFQVAAQGGFRKADGSGLGFVPSDARVAPLESRYGGGADAAVDGAWDGGTAAGRAAIRAGTVPGGWRQFPVLLRRQLRLMWRDTGQLWLQAALILTFPCLVAVFATRGLPQVRKLSLALETNVVRALEERLWHSKETFQAASLLSGLAMFQVVLLALMGANNGAREIARESAILAKERRAGLSGGAYVASKFAPILLLSGAQAYWMAWFVKSVCGFPGSLAEQFAVLWATTMAMSAACLAISAACASPERASLLAIYLVGFQLPLSGAALALPDWLNAACRPFIAAFWG